MSAKGQKILEDDKFLKKSHYCHYDHLYSNKEKILLIFI